MKAKEILIQVLGLVLLSVCGVALAILEIAFAAVPVALFIWFVYLILKYLGVFGYGYERFNSLRTAKGFGTIGQLLWPFL
jgi:hypothetical protein